MGHEMQAQNAVVDYAGQPLKVTLTGTGSKDPDGQIMKYRWLSGKRKPGTGAAGSGSAGRGGSGGGGAAGRAGGGAAGMTSMNDSDGGTAGAGGAG
ncbi:MAG TPA: hypothetical protein VJV78_25145, partial [Polyangiales bacterium]|nr:hypothetical protein [Polyangiales bacterium]